MKIKKAGGLLFIMIFAINPLFGQTSRAEMQKMYTDYINSEWGYSLYASNAEHVVFDDSQGNRFVIFINTNNTFQMGYYNQYLGESYTTDSLNRAKAAMESHLKDITVIFNGVREPGGWFMANIRLSRPDDFKKYFLRLFYSLRIANDLFYVELFKQRE
jgi:hypothetical protein